MNDRRQNLIVGLFAIGGLVVMGLLVMLFGDVLTFITSRPYSVNVIFPQGATVALREGTAVTLNGKRVGQTKAIEFRDPERPASGLVVKVAIDKRYGLPQGTRAQVLTSLMGFGRPALQLMVDEKLVGAPELPRNGTAEIIGKLVPMLDQLLPPEMQDTLETATRQLGQLADGLTPVANDLHRILEVRSMNDVDTQKLSANLFTAVQRLDASLKSLNAVIGNPENQTNMAAALANLRQSSEDLKTIVGQARGTMTRFDETLDTVRTNVDSSGRKLVTVADSADRLLGEAQKTFRLMNEGKGTAGLFLNDNRLYESLVLMTERLSKALDDIRDIATLMKKGEMVYRLR